MRFLLDENLSGSSSHGTSRPASPEGDRSAWTIHALKDVSTIASGVTLGRRPHAVDGREIPYLRVANVKDGYLDLSDVSTIRATPEEIDALLLQRGDLLLTEGGDPDK